MQNSPRSSLSARGYQQPRARRRGSTQGSCRGLPRGAGGGLGSCHSGQWPSVCAACSFSVGRGGGNSRALEKRDCQHAAAQGAAGTRALRLQGVTQCLALSLKELPQADGRKPSGLQRGLGVKMPLIFFFLFLLPFCVCCLVARAFLGQRLHWPLLHLTWDFVQH